MLPDDVRRDPYWTVVAYHNSLRELGKSRTFAVDDIPARIQVIARNPARLRELNDDNVQELTSNVQGEALTGRLERLNRRRFESDSVPDASSAAARFGHPASCEVL